MKRQLISLFIMLCLCFPLTAQSGWGGKGSGGKVGFFAEAIPASSGRTITVGGRLLPLRKISHNFNINGYVDDILVEVGDRVDIGQDLVRVKRDAVGETFLPVIIESRVRGLISEVHVYETEQITSGSPAVTIIDNSAYILLTSISDRDAQAIRNLGELSVTAVTPDGESFTGRIVRVSQEPDYNTGLFNITMEFRRQEGLFLGMVLFVDLPIEKAAGITIEKSALIMENDITYIWILNDENTLSLKAVTTGREVGDKITIESGLKAGERYITSVGGNEEEGMLLKDLVRANMDNSQGDGKE